jgi:hypothetical protein
VSKVRRRTAFEQMGYNMRRNNKEHGTTPPTAMDRISYTRLLHFWSSLLPGRLLFRQIWVKLKFDVAVIPILMCIRVEVLDRIFCNVRALFPEDDGPLRGLFPLPSVYILEVWLEKVFLIKIGLRTFLINNERWEERHPRGWSF